MASTYSDRETGEIVTAELLTEAMVTRYPDGGIFPAEPGNWLVTHAAATERGRNVFTADAFAAAYQPQQDTGGDVASPPPSLPPPPTTPTVAVAGGVLPADAPAMLFAEEVGPEQVVLPPDADADADADAEAPVAESAPAAPPEGGAMTAGDATTGGFLSR